MQHTWSSGHTYDVSQPLNDSFPMTLETSRCLFPCVVTRAAVYTMAYHRRSLLSSFHIFSLIHLKFTLIIQNFIVVLLFTNVSTLVIVFFFCYWLFCQILICFLFYHWIHNCDLLFFSNMIFILLILILDSYMNFIFIFNFPLQFEILGYTLVYFFLDLIHILLIAIFLFWIHFYNWFFFNFIIQQMICKELGFVIFLDEVLLV